MNTLGTSLVLEGLFGDADAEAMESAKSNSELAAKTMSIDVEDDPEGAVATGDSGMIVDDDGTAAQKSSTLCVFHPTNPVSKQ